ncbi:hypothetical protein [Glycomyces albidus]|uniref:hypothetical protein n=1 Tax=Glycomyces albidus TaxID=2656774 RepID=UPI00129086FB|nr:hypothetical protein [Glycomyces albidus]
MLNAASPRGPVDPWWKIDRPAFGDEDRLAVSCDASSRVAGSFIALVLNSRKQIG